MSCSPRTAVLCALTVGLTCAASGCRTTKGTATPTPSGDASVLTVARTVPGVSGVRQLALSEDGTWALGEGGAITYWGYRSSSYHDVVVANEPPHTFSVAHPHQLDVKGALRVAADDWACALLGDGSVRCFGTQGDGFNGRVDRLEPTTIPGVHGVDLHVTGSYGCVLGAEGVVDCWFGNPDEAAVRLFMAPMKLEGIADVVSLSGRDQTLYVRSKDGKIRGGAVPIEKQCTGGCYPGAKCEPDGFCGKRWPLATIEGLAPVVQVDGSLLGQHSCALVEDKTVWCWGANDVGQLGLGTTSPKADWVGAKYVPTKVPALENVSSIAVGTTSTCALLVDSTVRCWGGNATGQLGDGTTQNRTTPVPVTGLHDVIGIAVGGHHACAIVPGGKVSCWGANTSGQSGG